MKLAAWIRAKCNGVEKVDKEVIQEERAVPAYQPLASEVPIHRQHAKSCQCGICDFARKAGYK